MIYQNGVWSYRSVIYSSLREAVVSAKQQYDQWKQQQIGALVQTENPLTAQDRRQ